MLIIRSNELKFVPASHEDPNFPGSLKKVLLTKDLLTAGRVQMINWSLLPAGKSFRSHFHEDMEEVFIIITGNAKIEVKKDNLEKEADLLYPGDAVLIPAMSVHKMWALGEQDLEYIALGISAGVGGKTVLVQES